MTETIPAYETHMTREEILDWLVLRYVDVVTSVFSDDFNAPKRDQATFERCMSHQSTFTEREIVQEASDRYDFVAPPRD